MSVWIRVPVFAICLIGSATPSRAEEPEPSPACWLEPPPKEVVKEHVRAQWPNGRVRSVAIKFVDRSSVLRTYHSNGQIELEQYSDERHKKDGTQKRWHANGQLFVCATYTRGLKTGAWIYYNEAGRPTASYRYDADREIEHLTYSEASGWQRADARAATDPFGPALQR